MAKRTELEMVKAGLSAHKKHGYDVQVTSEEAFEILKATGGICRYCKKPMVRGEGKMHDRSPTIDRINNEKVMTKDNVQYICKQCNTTKGAHTHDEFIGFLRNLRNSFKARNIQ